MGPTMLIVDDEQDLCHLLRVNFRKDGYNVLIARSAETGLDLARKHNPAIFLLDIMLPKMDGLEMLCELRRHNQSPALFLTARKDEIDRILGFKLGADDYVLKPFSLEELRLRVQMIVKRVAGSNTFSGSRRAIRIGGVEVNYERHETLVNGRSVHLSPREFDVLQILLEAKGKVLTREQLGYRLWGEDRHPDSDRRIVDQHIARLRKKLEPERQLIATVSHCGYRANMGARPSGRMRNCEPAATL